ncbi:TetR/AcrR family transcriptional regulator [Streptomyces acidiscabies]|uniref:TetR/AcrR family transcriptional regulator n=1 Tax=Streptomyces acidiscabies TaxID=42234 RepID=A0AAP6BFF1_9ACTN|nr:TetR/AcrR family transcriptional regulator [Streptomyces acidiscabies]MDX2963761.1 TetR/AcrR family transcriptional regulator [Streptomyces acidiscabies]MDX3021592.1 TetR/AcrR family transcriptional regulator [Streptomyces acidiscabies]MDX3793859.1 TetR/AcrR family transcriptional regulator [Streptomyces acidiscabies]GAQ55031.1 DNA-binding transcriptional repressor AcrR [Streptomyces acidiscabies]GAV40634.1 DNA-binding transcriptional repressor AcrR [Streptomyces acidiscabies]
MTVGTATTDTRRGMPEKRRAIMRAARAVFGREGYTRAGVDTIALEAGVSNRTIYNHFTDKEQLFQTVALEGAEQVTAAISEILERHLRKIVDIREDLIAFGLERVAAVTEFPDHFALVRTIEAEASRIPTDVLEAWRDVGPLSAHKRLAPYLRRIAERGLLLLDDPERAANHFNLLTITDVNQRTFYGALPLPDAEVNSIVVEGVDTFLKLYGTD